MLKKNFWKANQERCDAEQLIIGYIDKNDRLLEDMRALQELSSQNLKGKDESIKNMKNLINKLEAQVQELQDLNSAGKDSLT